MELKGCFDLFARPTWGLLAMSLLRWKLHGRDREAEILKRQVTALQAALLQCTRAVQRTGFRRWLTVIVAALSLTVGFALGLYHDPILQGVSGVMRGSGLARVQDPEVAYAAYLRGRSAEVGA